MRRAPSRLTAWGGWILLAGCGNQGGAGRDAGAGGSSSLRDAAEVVDVPAADDADRGDGSHGGDANHAGDAGSVDVAGNVDVPGSGNDGSSGNDAGNVNDAAGVDLGCVEICALEATAACGNGDGCVDSCQRDRIRQRCRSETDALFACALREGQSAVICVDGGPALRPDRCQEQARALMDCYVSAG